MSEEVKTEQEETLYCECCGCVIDDDDYTEWNGQIICSDCLENHTTTCECCGERIWDEDVYGDNDITLCSHCYHHSYWKLTEQEEMTTLRKNCWTLQTPTPTCFTSRQTARWTMAWNWFRTPAPWTITSMNSRGKTLCTVPFVKATAHTRQAPAACISM